MNLDFFGNQNVKRFAFWIRTNYPDPALRIHHFSGIRESKRNKRVRNYRVNPAYSFSNFDNLKTNIEKTSAKKFAAFYLFIFFNYPDRCLQLGRRRHTCLI